MDSKQRICVVDENPLVRIGWERSLDSHAELFYYRDPKALFEAADRDPQLIPSFFCLILGRMYPHLGLDLITTEVPEQLRQQSQAPLFLNWQGFIAKDYLERNFDGKIFHRFGIKWHTLRLRIQRVERSQARPSRLCLASHSGPRPMNRTQRCRELLRAMCTRAEGSHRQKIEHYAKHDPMTGIKLLEAIYNRLLIDKNRPTNCPSRYINSSPIIAARILKEVLYH